MSLLRIPRWLAAEAAAYLSIRPEKVAKLLNRAKRTPYTTIRGADGSLYMERYWLIGPKSWLRFFLPLMRFHVIHREDQDRDPHDHPWSFQSLVLRGGYFEDRFVRQEYDLPGDGDIARRRFVKTVSHHAGESYEMGLGEFHKIVHVDGPVLTLVILNRRQEVWGFLTDHGEKIPWKAYLGLEPTARDGDQPGSQSWMP